MEGSDAVAAHARQGEPIKTLKHTVFFPQPLDEAVRLHDGHLFLLHCIAKWPRLKPKQQTASLST